MPRKVEIKLSKITTIFFDVDGVFTDGSLYFSDNEGILTKFNVHDGMGCILLRELGIKLLILTSRQSNAIIRRFKDLGINEIFTNVLKKKDFIKEYSKSNNLTKNEIAMMGDDLQDLAALQTVGVFFTTPNAVDIVKDKAHYITKRLGGNGAVREICDLIIHLRGSNSFLEFERYVKER